MPKNSENKTAINQMFRVTDNQQGVWYDGATRVDSLEIDRGALYLGQRSAEETRTPKVISIRMQLPQSVFNFTVNETVLLLAASRENTAM